MPQLSLPQALALAVQHHNAGRLPQAEELYRQILAQQPRHVEALLMLGVLANQVGRNDVAVDLLSQVLTLKPDWPEAHYNLGNFLRASGHRNRAIAAFRQAIALKPGFYDAHVNLANTLREIGQLDAAISVYQCAAALNPNAPGAHYNLAIALRESGQFAAAIAAFRRAIALKPDWPEAINHLGMALAAGGRLHDAIAAFRQTLALNPNSPEALNNLGNALKDSGHIDEAIAAFRQAIALNPNFPEPHNNLGVTLKDQGYLDEAIASARRAIALEPNYSEAHSNLLCTLHYDPNYDAAALYQEHLLWNRQHAAPLKHLIPPHTNDRSPDRRLKIGYISPDFRVHPVGRFILPLLAHHDKTQVEVCAYAQVPTPDELTGQLRTHTDQWRSLVGLSDDQAAQLIRADRIDILVDLTMHSAHNRLLVFARKPAPVQVTYLAYCSTTGLDTIDYRLSDPYMDPPGSDDSNYSEQTLRLPQTYWCYQPLCPCHLGSLPAVASGRITFGCLNNFCKVTAPTLATWARLLAAVPDAQLLLHAPEGSHRAHRAGQLQRLGVDPQRLRFASPLPPSEYLQLYHQIDLALDPFPYGGGTTTCDALWMGVPVISLSGATAVGRGGLSILSNLGLPELVASTPGQYVQIATHLAQDLPRLQTLRATLRQRMEQSPLMDASRFARDIESAYRRMWHKWCSQTPALR